MVSNLLWPVPYRAGAQTIILMARNKTCGKNEYARWRISSKRKEYGVFYNWKWRFQMELALLTCDNQVLRVKGCF